MKDIILDELEINLKCSKKQQSSLWTSILNNDNFYDFEKCLGLTSSIAQ